MAAATAQADPRPRASVLLLCFRDRDYIDAAFAAALAQTVPCEILVSNDASDDGTWERVQQLAAGYAGPHLLRLRRNERNLGVAGHVNATVPLTRGEVVVMMAGDDTSDPRRVERVLTAFDANPGVAALASDFEGMDAAGAPVEVRFDRGLERFGLAEFVASGKLIGLLGAALAFRREVFERFGPIRGPIEDNALALRAALLGDCMNLREKLVRYRQHGDSVSSSVFARHEARAQARRRRYERTIAFYRGTADDLAHCIAQLPELAGQRLCDARDLLAMYRLEADAREAILLRPRRQWLRPIWRGLMQRGLRRKSAERALKLLLPRRWLGL
jgi:glycosyltransferase involved in cell wall biosynthesis